MKKLEYLTINSQEYTAQINFDRRTPMIIQYTHIF